MNSQNAPKTTPQATGSFYKTLQTLRNTYPPVDDIGIPKPMGGTAPETEWSRDSKKYADMDFSTAKPVKDVPALAKLQAAQGGNYQTLMYQALAEFA
jgi:hypothetical protein